MCINTKSPTALQPAIFSFQFSVFNFQFSSLHSIQSFVLNIVKKKIAVFFGNYILDGAKCFKNNLFSCTISRPSHYLQALLQACHFRGDYACCFIAHLPRAARSAHAFHRPTQRATALVWSY